MVLRARWLTSRHSCCQASEQVNSFIACVSLSAYCAGSCTFQSAQLVTCIPRTPVVFGFRLILHKYFQAFEAALISSLSGRTTLVIFATPKLYLLWRHYVFSFFAVVHCLL